MRIEKKVDKPFFDKMVSGEKNFELRIADWSCKVGDTLVISEWDPETKEFTGRTLEKQVTYVLKTKDIDFWTKEEIEKFGFMVIALK
jgi:ribosomal protein S17